MNEFKLVKTRLFEGVWEGVLSGETEGTPEIEVTHLQEAVPGIEVVGLDISTYGLVHAKEEVRPFLREGHARDLPFDDDSFDLVLSLATLHNLGIADLFAAVREIQRVGRAAKYIMVESYRDEREKANLLYWQLTCESFFRPEGWHWIYDQCGYDGDSEFIYFE